MPRKQAAQKSSSVEERKPKNPSTPPKPNIRKTAVKLGAAKAPMPATLTPQLCTLVPKPFDREGWIFEIKWDGYRALAFKRAGKTDLHSRTGKSFNTLYPEIRKAVAQLPFDVILDGEVVAIDESGKSVFNWLQHPQENQGNIVYYVFDLLYYSNADLRAMPLLERASFAARSSFCIGAVASCRAARRAARAWQVVRESPVPGGRVMRVAMATRL